MDFNLQFPSRSQAALWLLIYTVPSLLSIFWSRQVLFSGVPHARTILARTFLLLGVVVIGLVVFSLVYPHEHHDTLWLPSSSQLSYPIDGAIGFFVATGALAAWNCPRSRRSRRTVVCSKHLVPRWCLARLLLGASAALRHQTAQTDGAPAECLTLNRASL